jgi:hypothetical protein
VPDTAPYVKKYKSNVAAVAAASDLETDLAVMDMAGTVSAVNYVPSTVLTGANTESRTIVLVNKGQAGAGTTVVATKAFTSGVNAPADDVTAITLSATPANLVVADGDVLVWQSNHVGATGLADPGGLGLVEVSRGV